MARSTALIVRASVCAESGRWDGVGRASSDVEKMRRARARATFVARNRLGDIYMCVLYIYIHIMIYIYSNIHIYICIYIYIYYI